MGVNKVEALPQPRRRNLPRTLTTDGAVFVFWGRARDGYERDKERRRWLQT